MKRQTVLIVLLGTFFLSAPAQAQQRGGGPGQRGGATAPAPTNPVPGQALEARRLTRLAASDPAWWTNTALMTRLGLTDVQKTRIESAFEAHRQNLVSGKELLEKEEAQLARLLEAETIDRSAVFTQINRVIQARGEMERTNATMTMEMREYLTRAQWMQLQGSPALALSTAAAGLQAAASNAPVRIGMDVAAANLITRVDPEYPALARAARLQGSVVLEAGIDKEGKVVNLRVVSGHQLLNDAALQAVRQWRYRPQMLNGQPVEVITTITVHFFLRADGTVLVQ